jgi:hypothetical protein
LIVLRLEGISLFRLLREVIRQTLFSCLCQWCVYRRFSEMNQTRALQIARLNLWCGMDLFHYLMCGSQSSNFVFSFLFLKYQGGSRKSFLLQLKILMVHQSFHLKFCGVLRNILDDATQDSFFLFLLTFKNFLD